MPNQLDDVQGGMCSYSSYVDFGPAMTNGNLDQRENVYRSSGLRRYLRYPDPTKNFKAVYTAYDQTKAGGFEVVTIGPYETEAVAYDALNQCIENLQQQGYAKATSAHEGGMPAVVLRHATQC